MKEFGSVSWKLTDASLSVIQLMHMLSVHSEMSRHAGLKSLMLILWFCFGNVKLTSDDVQIKLDFLCIV